MRADRTQLRRDERPLKVYAKDVALAAGAPLAGRRYHAQRLDRRLGVARDYCRKVAASTVAFEPIRHGDHLLHRKPGSIEVNASISVDLQIDPFVFHAIISYQIYQKRQNNCAPSAKGIHYATEIPYGFRDPKRIAIA